MGISNRRYAILGWVVWQVLKYAGKKKAREAVPGTGHYAGLNKGAIASLVLAIGGIFWLRHWLSDESGA